MSRPIVLFPSSSGAGATKAVSTIGSDFVDTVSAPMPVGQVLINLIGGKDLSKSSEADEAANELESRIVIPLGITPQNLAKFTLYDCLGLGTWADCADMDIIKKAYHKAVLLYHPDKQSYYDADGEEDRSVFLKIQQAYNTLCNESKRRAYDSQLPFDDNLPSDDFVAKALEKGPEKYLRVYDRVFKRNARFAVKKPVPEIGDVNTPIEEVLRFYEYWTNFESWRDFTGVGAEHDPDSATSRYEKRRWQQENEKLAKSLKMKEMNRIITLTDRAKTHDPRILAWKEAQKIEKEAKRAEKEAQRNAALGKTTPAATPTKEVPVLSKAEKEKLRKLESKIRNTFKKLLRQLADRCEKTAAGASEKRVGEYGTFSATDVENNLVVNSTMDELTAFNDALGGEEAVKDESIISGMAEDKALEIRAKIATHVAFCLSRKLK